MKTKQWKKVSIIISFLVLAAIAMSGCSKSDDAVVTGATGATGATGPTGSTGPTGPAGPTVTNIADKSAEDLLSEVFTGQVTGVTISSPPQVTFWIKDASGKYLTGLDTASASNAANLNYLRFAIAKLVLGEDGSQDRWVSYMLSSATAKPSSERVKANLTANADGSYTYVFAKDITLIAQTGGVTYQPTLQHRLVVQFNGTVPGTDKTIQRPLNLVYDFIPATGEVVAAADQRNITTKEACNSCHGSALIGGLGLTTPHGGRVDTKYCVICHNQQLGNGEDDVTSSGYVFSTQPQAIADGEVLGDMAIMIHKIHNGTNLVKSGYEYVDPDYQFENMAYTQNVTNCVKCHTASAAAPQGDNWMNRPSRQACGACHDGINWETGNGKTVAGLTTGHLGGSQTDDSGCGISACHSPSKISTIYHISGAEPNTGSNVPYGAHSMSYQIDSVTSNASNQPVVTFRVLKDGSAVTFNAYTGTTVDEAQTYYLTGMLTGFKGGPSLHVSYSSSANGVDYDNLGNGYLSTSTTVYSGQPLRVNLADLFNGTGGSVTGPDGTGHYVATLTTSNARSSTTGALSTNMSGIAVTFPADSTMRTVNLNGYFTQLAGTNGLEADLARHAVSVLGTHATDIADDTVRRTVANSEKCANCHNYIEGHGGNRVYEVQSCLPCHNPDLGGPWNMKDMIHNIHSAQATSTIMMSGPWDYVVYPAPLGYCLNCHDADTYGSVPTGARPSTIDWTSETSLDPITGPFTVITGADTVVSPYTAACISCHSKSYDSAHMVSNGAQIHVTRTNYLAAGDTETCFVCHGSGKAFDPAKIHKGLIEDSILP